MRFTAVDKNNRPGYYNSTEATWGGIPIEGPDGKFHLIHAQMANHCPLGSWTTASIVARATADTLLGPYTFAEEMIPPFAHNPTIRKIPGGGYVIWFIGGWSDVGPVPQCKGPLESTPEADYARYSRQQPEGTAEGPAAGGMTTTADCSVVYDPPSEIRVGSDVKTVQLPANATIKDCGASCCDDPGCLAFSFNTFANGDAPICKHKDANVAPQKGNGCPLVKGLPSCMSGGLPNRSICNGQSWPKDSCPPEMPGPNADCVFHLARPDPLGHNRCRIS